MRGAEIFQEISAGAISTQMPPCKAIVVNLSAANPITPQLQELYSFTDYRVYVVNSTMAKLGAILERCNEIGIPAIVNCGEKLPPAESWRPERSYRALLVAPGSSKEEGNILSTIATDKSAESFSVIGYQTYRYNPEDSALLRKRYFEEMRLGIIREDITQSEPIIRDAEYIFMDMRSLRFSDYPSSGTANPNGMYAEEICTIARYMGLANGLKAIFIYGEEPVGNSVTICNKLIAESVWHICEGIVSNIPENPNLQDVDNDFSRKIVTLGDNGENISFITSYTTQRWWMEIPVKEGGARYVSCSIKEYNSACMGEIPLRWLFFYQKYTL